MSRKINERAWWCRFSEDPIAGPGADQVQIKILAAPITGYDLASVKGLRSGSACGNEGVGVVTSVGSDVSGLLVNDKVVPVVAGLGKLRYNPNAKHYFRKMCSSS